MQPTTTLTLTLEWFLNPDHLPFIAGVTTGAYEQAGLDITIIEPAYILGSILTSMLMWGNSD